MTTKSKPTTTRGRMSAEQKAKLSAAAKKLHKDPAYRRKYLAGIAKRKKDRTARAKGYPTPPAERNAFLADMQNRATVARLESTANANTQMLSRLELYVRRFMDRQSVRDVLLGAFLVLGLAVNILHYVAWLAEVN